MRWKGRKRSANVNDSRGQGGGFSLPGSGRRRLPVGGSRRGGGMGIGTIIIIGQPNKFGQQSLLAMESNIQNQS